jgi:hypothetical protein
MPALRGFTPFEREQLAAIAELRAERACAREEELAERLRSVEKGLES